MYRSLTSLVVMLVVAAAGVPAAIGPAAAQDVTLTVTVQDPNGQAISNADLTATWDGGQATATTASNGQALIDVPEGADVEISVNHSDFVRNSPLQVDNAQAEEITMEVALASSATITVEDGGSAVSGSTVFLFQDHSLVNSGQTASDGTITFDPIERGDYSIRVTKGGYYDYNRDISVDQDTQKTAPLNSGSAQVTFTVTDDHFDQPKPVESAKVEITQLGTTLTTLADGTAQTNVPVNREYDIEVTKSGYDAVTQSLQVEETDTALEVNIQRTDEITLSTANSQVVVGETTELTVTDEYGDPVEGATVTHAGQEVGQTKSDGTYQVTIDQSGEVTLEVSQQGQSDSVTVEGITPGGDSTPTAQPEETDTPGSTDEATEDEDGDGDGDGDSDGDDGPGFGLVAALVAVGVAVGLARRRAAE